MSFSVPWVDPRDVTALGRGRYLVACVFVGEFRYDLIVEMKT